MAQITSCELAELEMLIDRIGLVATIDALAEVCSEKAMHVQETWQDGTLSRHWIKLQNKLTTTSNAIARIGDLP